jgi:hypothetical protein
VPTVIPNFSDFVIGFHGTAQDVVDDVLSGRESLLPNPRGYDWLGDGIYFWEDDARRALWWAQRTKEEGAVANRDWQSPVKVVRPAVVGAVIYIGNCLNLAHDHTQDGVRETYLRVAARYSRDGYFLPKNEFFYRNLDCLVVNETCRILQRLPTKDAVRIDTVRGVFPGVDEGSERAYAVPYPGSLLMAQTYKIIAVRSRRSIVSYFPVTVEPLNQRRTSRRTKKAPR